MPKSKKDKLMEMLEKSKRARQEFPSQPSTLSQSDEPSAVSNSSPTGPGMVPTSQGKSAQAMHMSSQVGLSGPVGLTGAQFLETQKKENVITLDKSDWISSNA